MGGVPSRVSLEFSPDNGRLSWTRGVAAAVQAGFGSAGMVSVVGRTQVILSIYVKAERRN